MSRPLNIILGFYNHIPNGITDDEFETIYHTQLKPCITALNQHPGIQVVLHYSGVLLQRIYTAHREFFMLIKDLIARKQVELLGGGFYEPLMPLLPLADKIGQIEFLTTYLRQHFGKRPQGCWLPALAWEQNMVGALNTCGMGFTFLDEGQFRLAGISGEGLYTPCFSEDQGKIITIFPISNRITAEMGRKKASRVIEDLVREIPEGQKRIITVFPKELYTEGDGSELPEFRFRSFFEELSRAQEFMEFTSPGKIFKNQGNLKKAYFPSSLETEFSQNNGSPPAGILPQQFLIRYPEANGIYAKMIFTHVLINQLRGDKSRKRTAREELWKAQGYDAFCPGNDGGIYRHPVRKAVYRALIEAERITREKGGFIPSLMNFDFDLDGQGEYLFRGERVNCYVQLEGASVFELDYLPEAWNYLDTFNLPSPPSPKEDPPLAGRRRTAFADYLVPKTFTSEDVREGCFYGARFCGGERFELLELDRVHGKVCFWLPRNPGLPYGNVEIEKSYYLKKNVLSVTYALINRGEGEENFVFIPGIDLSFPGEGEAYLRILQGNTVIKGSPDLVLSGAGGLKFRDLKNKVTIDLCSDKSFDAWLVPIRTPDRPGGGNRDHYQSTWILPRKTVLLQPGDRFDMDFTLEMHP
ncbi:MAG: DUF1926 domain-containing protein [Treponema sp.]|jgi:hypothetical protein|nr:DUF1926 domain-containing protein [Treponema sp.]